MHPVGLEPMISTWPPQCCSYNESIGKVVEIYSDENIKKYHEQVENPLYGSSKRYKLV